MEKECPKHGVCKHIKSGKNSWRCHKCNIESVTEYRRKVKMKLIEMFGGACSKCGYNRYAGGLEFHHLAPEHKDFSLSSSGVTRKFEQMVSEAKKCILVCALCHREIHAGIIRP